MDESKCVNCRRRTSREFDGYYLCRGKKSVGKDGNVGYIRCVDMPYDMCSQKYDELPPMTPELERFYQLVTKELGKKDYYSVLSYLRELYAEGYTTEFLVYAPIEEVFEKLCKEKPISRSNRVRYCIRVYREFVTGEYQI